MKKLPKHLINALRKNYTSLGDHPAFPPDEEEKFTIEIISSRYEEVSKGFENSNINDLKKELSELIHRCIEIESKNKEALEKICFDTINNFFHIPQDSINIDIKLNTHIDNKNHRLIPDKTGEFTFDDIKDLNNLTDEIYKRRMLNAIISGASLYYVNKIPTFVDKIKDIDSNLPYLYNRIWNINNYLMFEIEDSLIYKNTSETGKCDVFLQTFPNVSTIKVQGLIFPVLLRESLKSILELTIANGLPNDFKKAEYIMKKADFKLSENWDERLGFCLWSIIANIIKEQNIDPKEIGIHFIIMELSLLKVNEFNIALQNIFKKTSKGVELINKIIDKIQYSKDEDDFYNQIDINNKEYQLNDNDEFTSEELLNEVDKEVVF